MCGIIGVFDLKVMSSNCGRAGDVEKTVTADLTGQEYSVVQSNICA